MTRGPPSCILKAFEGGVRSLCMRLLAVLVCSILSAGCLATDGDDGSDAADDLPSGTMRASKSVELELGRHSVNMPRPGLHTFTATVPPGGADDVRWQLTITGSYLTSTVSGHGCGEGVGPNVNLVIGVAVTSTRGGPCDALSAGEAEFTVNLTDAATAFTATIVGTVTVPADGE